MTKNTYNFHRYDPDSLILVYARVNQERATLALDTGATHTVIDLTVLLMAGYSIKDSKEVVPMETAKGTIDAYVFNLAKIIVSFAERKNRTCQVVCTRISCNDRLCAVRCLVS